MIWKKHRRLWCGLLAACCLFAGLSAVAAGDSGNTLATLSYLKNTFLPILDKGIAERVQAGGKEICDAALARVDELGKAYSESGPAPSEPSGGKTGWTVSETARPADLTGGQLITLDEGGSILWLGGSASTEYGLVDATRGAAAPAGWKLETGHRYLNGLEGKPVHITVLSDAAQAAPAGRWTATAGVGSATPFFDLARTDWFYDGVCWAYGKGIFQGVSDTRFNPGGTVNRATLATVLHRLEGSAAVAQSGTFTDVPSGQWYTAGIEWSAANGIVGGNGDGTFSPTRPATREQIAVMLCRYAQYLGRDVSVSGSLDGFRDSDSVSGWARDAMSWAVGIGLLNGSDGALLPQNSATRAQVAIMLQRFQKWTGRD